MFDGKFLCLDGGGVRGLVIINILKYLPQINYDVIIGTSTGAIITCLLSVGYSIEEIINFYSKESIKDIFKPYLFPLIHQSLYNPKNIEKVLLEKLKNIKLKDIKQKIIIPAYNIKTRKIILFNNFEKRYSEIYLREITRASTAAPFYFTPYNFLNFSFIDGGVISNNPAMLAYSYLKNIYNNPLIVSIGTGTFDYKIENKDMCFNNPITFIKNTLDCFMDGSSDSVDLELENILKENYIRFQIKLTEELSKIDNVSDKNINNLIKLTEYYINNNFKENIQKLKNIQYNKQI